MVESAVPYLDYGALGVLMFVLVAVLVPAGVIVRGALKRADERRAKFDQQEQERRALQDQFMRELVEGASQERNATIGAMQALSTQSVEALQTNGEAMSALCSKMEEHEQRTGERHGAAELSADKRHAELLAAVKQGEG